MPIVVLLTALVEVFGKLTAALRASLVGSITTTLMLMFLYIVTSAVQSGSLIGGLDLAIWRNTHKNATDEIAHNARAQQLIHVVMSNVMDRYRGASSLRLTVIHNGVAGLTGIPLLHYDVIAAVGAPGRDPGSMTQNNPMSIWTHFLPTLLRGECTYQSKADFDSANLPPIMREGISIQFLACPIIDVHGVLLGALFLNWYRGDLLPTAAEIVTISADLHIAATQIAAALDLRAP